MHIVPKIKVKRQQKGIRKLREGFQLHFAASPTKFLAFGTKKRTRVGIATLHLTFFRLITSLQAELLNCSFLTLPCLAHQQMEQNDFCKSEPRDSSEIISVLGNNLR